MLPDYFIPTEFSRPGTLGFRSEPHREVRTVADFFTILADLGSTSPLWARGEERPFPQPSLPKFARDYVAISGSPPPTRQIADLELIEPLAQAANGQPVLLSCLTDQEVDILRNFQNDPPDDEYYFRMVGDDLDHPGWFSFAQHYGQPTRLLDVSSDPLVGLYFACQPPDNEQGTVWLYPDLKSIHGPHPPTSIYDAFEPAIRDKQALAHHQNNSLNQYQPNPGVEGLIQSQFLFDFEAPNRRVIAQKGKFIWSGSPLRPLQANAIGVDIPGDAKAEILASIAAFGIREECLFPD